MKRRLSRSDGRQGDVGRLLPGWRLEPIDLSREDEVTLRKAVYLVRPYCNFDPSPAEVDVGVMSLLFGELAYLIDEVQSLLEVLEPEVAA